MKSPPLNPRRAAAFYSTIRWAVTLLIAFVLVVAGYYFYVDVINRVPADVYIVHRGTAISAVYGTNCWLRSSMRSDSGR